MSLNLWFKLETNDGRWHVEETWPPEDMTWDLQDIGTNWLITGSSVNGFGSSVTLVSEELSELTHMSEKHI